jgi:hypothetical protein
MESSQSPLQAKYDYRSGHILLVPRTGFAPGLLLEYIENYQTRPYARRAIDIIIKVSPIEKESEYFVVTFPGIHQREFYTDLRVYINDNLPKS